MTTTFEQRPKAPKPKNDRDSWSALLTGARGRCPNCRRGHLFKSFLTVADHCEVCGQAFHHHRADDAPAYFVILIVGHVVVPLVLAVETRFAPDYWVHAVLWIPLTFGLALALLPRIKGAIIAWQWAHRMHGFDPDSDEDGEPRWTARTATRSD